MLGTGFVCGLEKFLSLGTSDTVWKWVSERRYFVFIYTQMPRDAEDMDATKGTCPLTSMRRVPGGYVPQPPHNQASLAAADYMTFGVF